MQQVVPQGRAGQGKAGQGRAGQVCATASKTISQKFSFFLLPFSQKPFEPIRGRGT